MFVYRLQVRLEQLADKSEQQACLQALKFEKDSTLVEMSIHLLLSCNALRDDRLDHSFKQFIKRESVVALSDHELWWKSVFLLVVKFTQC